MQSTRYTKYYSKWTRKSIKLVRKTPKKFFKTSIFHSKWEQLFPIVINDFQD